jgi:hypothetical protein
MASTNLALKKVAKASAIEKAGFEASAAVDGNPATRWSSAFQANQWITIDLGISQIINCVHLTWEAAYAKSYSIQVSLDEKTWSTVYTTSAGKGGTEKIGFKPVSARYVRMQGIKPARYGYSMYDFSVFNELITDSIFAPTSFWYQPIPANAPLDPNSANLTANLTQQIKTHYNNVILNTTSYASPVYIAEANIPTVAVKFWDCQGKGYTPTGINEQWSAVPIPSFAAPATGTDAEMTIYQPSTDTLWEFWQTKHSNGVWQACWGGRLQNVSKNNGTWPGGFGTTATGLPFLGGQISAEELQRGEICHAIGISLVDVEAHWRISWPAQRSDGYNPNGAPNRIAEGQRFRLDPTIDVNKLNIHPVAKTIARAAQKYGFIVWDKAGSVSLRAWNPKGYTLAGKPDPYSSLFNGTANYALLNGFPWDKLQFLPINYGKV